MRQDGHPEEARKLLERALRVRPGEIRARFQLASAELEAGRPDRARLELEDIVKRTPRFAEAHIALATAYYRLDRKADGDRERAIARKLTDGAMAAKSKE